MELKFYKPTNKTLQKYIEGYYFIREDKTIIPIKYWTYPNNYSILTVNRNFSVNQQDNLVVLQASNKSNILTCLVTRYTKPMQICYKHLIDELTIYFKPLGINQFVKNSNEIFNKKVHIDFIFSKEFNAKMQAIFDLDIELQIAELEAYLISILQEKEFDLMLKLINDIEADSKIEEIAKTHNLSRQYINKLFLKHLGKSPSEYRKIHRFRNAILKFKESKNYTDLSQNGFYDQSHFNKDFKMFTDRNPQSFFSQVNTNQENIWFFI